MARENSLNDFMKGIHGYILSIKEAMSDHEEALIWGNVKDGFKIFFSNDVFQFSQELDFFLVVQTIKSFQVWRRKGSFLSQLYKSSIRR